MVHRSRLNLVPGFLVAILAGGCASPRTVVHPLSVTEAVQAVASEPIPYVIQAGDELEIRFFHLPEQNIVLPVRPDGYISIPLANEVRAAGRTCEQLRLELVRLLEAELAAPEIAVIVRTFTAYKVHVGGHVQRAGMFELTGKRSVLQAIFEAEGVLPTGSLEHVLVLRRMSEDTIRVIPVDLKAALSGEDPQQNLQLQPYDAVYVAPSAIADVNKWVDQYIRQNLPFNVGWRIEFQ